jgi:hypothetical protein
VKLDPGKHKGNAFNLGLKTGCDKRFASFQGPRQARNEVHWTIHDFEKER